MQHVIGEQIFGTRGTTLSQHFKAWKTKILTKLRQKIASRDFVIATKEYYIALINCTETSDHAQEREFQLSCTKASWKTIFTNFQKPYVANTLRRIDLFTIPRWRRHHRHNLHSAGAISMHLSQLREENKRIKHPTSTFNSANSRKALLHCFLHTRNRECLHIYSRHVMKKKQQPQHRLSVANLEISSLHQSIKHTA